MDTDALGEDFIEQDSYDVPFQTIPPGEEGVGVSHAGGEYEAFHSFAEDLTKLFSFHEILSKATKNPGSALRV